MPRNTDYFDSEQFEQDLLNAYFHFRCNLPMKDADPVSTTRRVSRPPGTSPRNLMTWAVSV